MVPHLVASCLPATLHRTTTTFIAPGPLRLIQEKPSGNAAHIHEARITLLQAGGTFFFFYCTPVNSHVIPTQLITWHADCIGTLLRGLLPTGICSFKSIIVRVGGKKNTVHRTQAKIIQLDV